MSDNTRCTQCGTFYSKHCRHCGKKLNWRRRERTTCRGCQSDRRSDGARLNRLLRKLASRAILEATRREG